MRMFYTAGLILCLAAVLGSAQNVCPYPEEIEPCFCTPGFATLTCKKVHDTEVLLRVFENARRLRFLKFTLVESTLQYIPHQIFDDVAVDVLLMENVTLRNMFDEVPGSPDIREIQLSGVKVLGGLDWEDLSGFDNLDALTIWDMPLRKLAADSFSNVPKKLRNLYFENCEIKKLEDNLFADFTGLESVQLPYNEIVDIKRTLFPRKTKLRILVLEYNKISSLPDDMFSDMPFLYGVYFEGNQLAVLSEATFQPVFSLLTYLDVTANPIKCDCLIAWVLEEKRGMLKGKCAAPKAIRDKDIDELTREDIRC